MSGLAIFIIVWVTFAILRPSAVGVWLARVRSAYDKELKAGKP